MTPVDRAAAVLKLREILDFRLPQSGDPLSTVVLTRAEGEALLEEIMLQHRQLSPTDDLDKPPGDGH